jgi:hypothetical protein
MPSAGSIWTGFTPISSSRVLKNSVSRRLLKSPRCKAPREPTGTHRRWVQAYLARTSQRPTHRPRGLSLKLVFPKLTPNIMEGGALIAGAKGPRNGKLFLDFAASPEGAAAYASFVRGGRP